MLRLVVPLVLVASSALAHPDRAARLALFRDLVDQAKKHHVFAPVVEANLGRKWESELPRLEAEFAGAERPELLGAALYHFQNSLRNRHCYYDPPGRARVLTAGISVEVEWKGDAPTFYVAEVTDAALAGKVARGDLVVEVDGVPAADFLERFSLESNANHWRQIADDVAEFLGERYTGVTAVREGDPSSFVFRGRANGKLRRERLIWRPKPRGPRADIEKVDYGAKVCADLPARDYGPYKLRDTGMNYCLYTSDAAPFSAYPIVRHFSFWYDMGPTAIHHLLRLEHKMLSTQLAAVAGARGVILDLRDNHGGNNPNWFFDWWAPGPYVDDFVEMKLSDDLGEPGKLERLGWSADDVERYLAALKGRKPGQEFSARRPFFCRPDGCEWDNRYTPSHQVTKLPIALLVGPMCTSACDSLALIFHLYGFGPLVGQPAAAAYTAVRIEVPVRGGELGTLRFALSREVSGKTGELIEGRRVPMDVAIERTFTNRARYDALLVEGAIGALERRATTR